MFTQKVSRLAELLPGPHGWTVTELVDSMWTRDRGHRGPSRAPHPVAVTLWLRPNKQAGYRAGQHLTVTVDQRPPARPVLPPANAEGDRLIELTVTCHDGGTVSEHLIRHARRGMVVGLSAPAGDFVLPENAPNKIVFIAGGSGITPVMGMLRTLQAQGYDGDVAVLHYVRTPQDACYST